MNTRLFCLKQGLILGMVCPLLMMGALPLQSLATPRPNRPKLTPTQPRSTTLKLRKPKAAPLLGGAKGVLIYCGNGSTVACTGSSTTFRALITYYQTTLGSTVTQASVLPASFTPYRLMFIITPTVAFTPAQFTQIQGFVRGGGRVVVVGDNTTAWSGTVIANDLLKKLWNSPTGDLATQFTGPNVGGVCAGVTSYGVHPLTDGFPVTGLAYAGGTTLNLNANGWPLVQPSANNQMALVSVMPLHRYPVTTVALNTGLSGGDVVVAGDLNLFGNPCNATQNQPLWKNLFLTMDDDDDGLLNDWEVTGDTNGDGVLNSSDVNLPSLGAKFNHKDIFVEIDWMTGCPGTSPIRQPATASLNLVKTAFANAPLLNPDGTTGINLHPIQGNAISSCPTPLVWPSGFQTLKNANFTTSRQKIFHYNIWGYALNYPAKPDTSGIGELLGDDFFVSLGVTTGGGNGSPVQQAGTYMHELGHNLGLCHDGNCANDPNDNLNFKPNHLSVMNYSFQQTGLRFNKQFGKLDYNRFSPPSLNENGLSERAGLTGGTVPIPNTYGVVWYCGGQGFVVETPAGIKDVSGNLGISWNCKNGNEPTPVATDINNSTPALLQQLSTPTQTWASIKLASNTRPGILGGDDVQPFRLSSKLAQQEQPTNIVETSGFTLLIDGARMVIESEGKTDPSKLPGLTAQVVPNGVQLTWQPVPQSKIRGRLKPILEYEIYRTGPDGSYRDTLIGKTQSLSFLDKSVRKGRSYYYRVVTNSFVPKDAEITGHNFFWDRTPILEVPK